MTAPADVALWNSIGCNPVRSVNGATIDGNYLLQCVTSLAADLSWEWIAVEMLRITDGHRDWYKDWRIIGIAGATSSPSQISTIKSLSVWTRFTTNFHVDAS